MSESSADAPDSPQREGSGARLNVLQKACLGRQVHLGMLYDFCSDSFIPVSTLRSEMFSKAITSEPRVGSTYELITDDSFEVKASHLDVDNGQQLSLLLGLVNVEGVAKFLLDCRSSMNQSRASLMYKSTTKLEQLAIDELGKIENPCLTGSSKAMCTHIVTGIEYGVDAVFVFDSMMASQDSLEKIIEELAETKGTEFSSTVSQDRHENEASSIGCTFYADMPCPKQPKTYSVAIEVLLELPKHFGVHDGVPKKVWLHPISELDNRAHKVVHEISPGLIGEIQSILNSVKLLEVQSTLRNLLTNEVCTYFSGIKCDLENMITLIAKYIANFKKRLANLLPKVRGGDIDEAEIADALKENKSSPFSLTAISTWVEEKTTEVKILAAHLDQIKQQENIKLVFQADDEMYSLRNKVDLKFILCFDYNICKEDMQLEKMKLHLRSREKGVRKENWATRPDPWYKKQNQHMRKRLLQFLHLAKANCPNVAYIVTNGNTAANTEKSDQIPCMWLYENGSPSAFEPPDQPGKPQAFSVTGSNSIHISWEKPQSAVTGIKSYTLLFHSSDEQPNKWHSRSIPPSKEEDTITTISSQQDYVFKVRAETAVGAGPESEPSDPVVYLTLEAPGKPVASTVYRKSVELYWEKPQHHQMSALLSESTVKTKHYIIAYSASTDPPDKWQIHKTSTSEQHDTVDGLSPDTVYFFKVRAETTAGTTPESELSEAIMTQSSLPPPGKPYATDITHNAVTLEWNIPNISHASCPYHQVDTLQQSFRSVIKSYTVFFRSQEDPPDQWEQFTTGSAIRCVTVPDLSPRKVYFFKLRAKTNNTTSQDSEVSNPIRTKVPLLSPPGKPYANVVTHDSIQLKWEKPKDGDEMIVSYKVFYQPMQESGDKWSVHSTMAPNECFTVKNLEQKTTYIFKVAAETSSGTHQQSEASDSIVTKVLSPPGKPYSSEATHNSIHLKWNRPEDGAELIKSYKILYCSLDQSTSRNWSTCSITVGQECFTIKNLQQGTKYLFKVQAETSGTHQESEASDPIETKVLSPPGKPCATNVTRCSIQLTWAKPTCGAEMVTSYKILHHSFRNPEESWSTCYTKDSKECCTISDLHHNTNYFFKIVAETSSGPSEDSEVSDSVKTQDISLAEKLIPFCKKIDQDDTLCIYKLKATETMVMDKLIKVDVGIHPAVVHPTGASASASVSQKVLMLVGASGAGKSTLINSIANYVLGVKWENDYRFKLISEPEEEDQCVSQTKHITAYTFHQCGSVLPYTLTVIDTPGFGDTEGMEKDKHNFDLIRNFFSEKTSKGIDQLHAVGFVAKASEARLTPAHKYVYDTVLQIFGNDMTIFVVATHASPKEPPVLKALKTVKVPFQKYFKFENSALFEQNSEASLYQMFWKISMAGFEDLFDQLSLMSPQSLVLTREVLAERQKLHALVKTILPQISSRLATIEKLKQEQSVLDRYEADIHANERFTYTVTVTEKKREEPEENFFFTVCTICDKICHRRCSKRTDSEKKWCSAMTKNKGKKNAICGQGDCSSNECLWSVHENRRFMMVEEQVVQIRTIDDLKATYESALSNKSDKEEVIAKIKNDLDNCEQDVLRKICKLKKHTMRLQEIAMRPVVQTEIEYIDYLIESTKQEAQPGWEQRVATLQGLQKIAKVTVQAFKNNPEDLLKNC